MEKKFLLQITNELYRMTLLFPKKEPLRYKMREIGDEILAKCLTSDVKQDPTQHPELNNSLEVLDSFFEVAKNQNWIKPEDFLNLQKEYSKLRENLEKLEIKNPPVKNVDVGRQHQPTEVRPLQNSDSRSRQEGRQEKILTFLKEKEKAQVWQIKQIFPQTSKRTLRRDFENLFKQGIIERIGERNETYYIRARQSRAKDGEEDLSSSTQLKEG